MISFSEAQTIVEQYTKNLATETVSIEDALHRVLAQKIVADRPHPPFSRSLRDGYACRRQDLGTTLTVLETIKAGATPSREITQNQCSKIMTGAPIPKGADCVFMVEYAERVGGDQVRFTGEHTEDNIAIQGSDLTEGDILLEPGIRIAPQHIAIMASVGCIKPYVYQVPRVAVLSTGDELVLPHIKPKTYQIRSSNGLQLSTQAQHTGSIVKDFGIVPDIKDELEKCFMNATQSNNVIIFSGGVSKGDFDYVPEILERNGFTIHFNAVRVRPGKPLTFACKDSTYVFGLPGNPVSSFVQFHLMVAPFLHRLQGNTGKHPVYHLPLDAAYKNPTSLQMFLPATINAAGNVQLLEYHGSAHIHAYNHATGIAEFSPKESEYAQGELIPYHPLS